MKAILIHTWKVLQPKERRRFIFLIVFDIAMSVIDILSLVALLWIIQFYLGGENQSFIPSWMPERSSLWPIGIFVILFAIKNTVGFFISRVGHSFISNVALRISVLNLKNYQQAPFEEFINVDSSVHIRKIAFQPY